MSESNEAWRAVTRAWREDPEYRARMQADPKAALAEEGVHIQADDVRVVVDTDEVRHLVMPSDPNAELSDEELVTLSGGASIRGGFDFERFGFSFD